MIKTIIYPAVIVAASLAACQVSTKPNNDFKELSVKEYSEKVYASWIGQIIGNTYGLSYEFTFIDQPGPDVFPYGFGPTLERVKEVNGAFSDDDTDIEYIYLLQMEKHGITPTYKQLADAWKYHVRDKVWCANRIALGLMWQGYYPPATGQKELNAQFCQIDPQLINEIWAVTAPGMTNYAVEKSKWAARIMADSMGLEPTMHYAAMYSAAFFESDVHKLIEIGTAALPAGSYFARVVEHIKKIHQQHPEDWKKARELVKTSYCVKADYNRYSWEPIDACLNGACGILALLYGEGDFQKTLDMCCALGFDADNQAASMCGLLGIANGLSAIPGNLLNPLPERQWKKPFNDLYKNVSRHDMPDATLTDMARRMAAQGEKVILAQGGEVIEKNGEAFYRINTKAAFSAPFELNPAPAILLDAGEELSYDLYTGAPAQLRISEGSLPPGMHLSATGFAGASSQKGTYHITISAEYENELIKQRYTIVITDNLAQNASTVLFNSKESIRQDIELIRDGQASMTKSFGSEGTNDRMKTDYYGFQWEQPVALNTLVYNTGLPDEFGGWFTSLNVEYRNKHGQWTEVPGLKKPDMDLSNTPFLKPTFTDYVFTFDSLQTTAIRIVGQAGGTEKDAHNAHLGKRYWTAISELSAYFID